MNKIPLSCVQCGHELPLDANFCPSCGRKLTDAEPTKKKMSPWIPFLFLFAAFCALVAFWAAHDKESIEEPIKGQLNALKNNKVTEAYFGYTSKEFQDTMSLEAFRNFVHAHPEFSQVESVDFQQEETVEDHSLVQVALLNNEKKSIALLYRLVKQDSKWKIENLSFVNEKHSRADEEDDEVLQPVKDSLEALRASNFPKAYRQTLSNDYKKKTTLKQFEAFIRENPIITHYQSIDLKDSFVEDGLATVVVVFHRHDEEFEMEYKLKQHGSRWKIWDIAPQYGQLAYEPALTKNSEPPSQDGLEEVIQGQLDAIRQGDLLKAYNKFTSNGYKDATSYADFQRFVQSESVFKQNKSLQIVKVAFQRGTPVLRALLESQSTKALVEFHFVEENNRWRIDQIELLSHQEKMTQSVEEKVSKALKIVKVDIGSKVDEKGYILNPSNTIPSHAKDIYVNIYVKNGSIGDKVEVLFKDLESESQIPSISTTIKKQGDSVFSLVFSPPPTGWPAGEYLLLVTSSTGARAEYSFRIRE